MQQCTATTKKENMTYLGKLGKDKITGFEGIVTGKAEYLYGCTQYCLVPRVSDGKLGESQWFDEGRIEISGEGIAPSEVRGEKPGGPNRDAPRR
jgi:hypothetical protein